MRLPCLPDGGGELCRPSRETRETGRQALRIAERRMFFTSYTKDSVSSKYSYVRLEKGLESACHKLLQSITSTDEAKSQCAERGTGRGQFSTPRGVPEKYLAIALVEGYDMLLR